MARADPMPRRLRRSGAMQWRCHHHPPPSPHHVTVAVAVIVTRQVQRLQVTGAR